jgi:hypothetical protein
VVFDERCMLGACVVPPSNAGGILDRRALAASADLAGVPRPSSIRARRFARLGATPDFHHERLRARRLCRMSVTDAGNGIIELPPNVLQRRAGTQIVPPIHSLARFLQMRRRGGQL